MRARNISHRLIAIITFAVGVAAFQFWFGESRPEKSLAERSEVTNVLTPAREIGYYGELIEASEDWLIVNRAAQQRSLSEPVESRSSEPDLIEYNCGTLLISIEIDGRIIVNTDPTGTLNDLSQLSDKLRDIFDERVRMGVYSSSMQSRTDLPDKERVYKTVLIKPAPSLPYSDVVKVVEAVKDTGARPIAIRIYNLPNEESDGRRRDNFSPKQQTPEN